MTQCDCVDAGKKLARVKINKKKLGGPALKRMRVAKKSNNEDIVSKVEIDAANEKPLTNVPHHASMDRDALNRVTNYIGCDALARKSTELEKVATATRNGLIPAGGASTIWATDLSMHNSMHALLGYLSVTDKCNRGVFYPMNLRTFAGMRAQVFNKYVGNAPTRKGKGKSKRGKRMRDAPHTLSVVGSAVCVNNNHWVAVCFGSCRRHSRCANPNPNYTLTLTLTLTLTPQH